LKEEKLKQLRTVFKSKIEQYFTALGYYSQKRNFSADDLVKELIYEVKIRATDRKEVKTT